MIAIVTCVLVALLLSFLLIGAPTAALTWRWFGLVATRDAVCVVLAARPLGTGAERTG